MNGSRRRRTFVRGGLATLGLALGFTVAAPALPAHAGSGVPPCGPSCNGLDPNTFSWYGHTCAYDAVTIYQITPAAGRTLQLRYSNRCETTWARIYGAQFPDVIRVENNYPGVQIEMKEMQQGETEGWTMMIDDHGVESKACWWIGWAHRGPCTGAY